MARFAKVDVRVWDDSRVRAMTPIPPCGQGLWIRLLVSRHRSAVPGLLCVGEAALAEELGWTLEAFREAFREAFAQGLVKADWKARLVWIPNAFNYNRPESWNVVKSWRVPWDEAPECELKNEAFRTLKSYVEGMSEGFREAFTEACAMPCFKPLANQEQEQEQEQEEEDCAEVTEDGDDSTQDEPLLIPDLPPEPALLTFTCAGNKQWRLTETIRAELSAAYPAVNVMDVARRALEWCRANPRNVKTAKRMRGWLGSVWCAREQDKALANGNNSQQFNQPRQATYAKLT